MKESIICLVLMMSVAVPGGFARDQWAINHGGNNPQVDPRFAPGGSFSGMVGQFTPAFWQNQLANRVPVGTVLTATLENDLSSAKSKTGDAFTLTLQDGFVMGDKALIPANSKVLGSIVMASPAAGQKSGMPGQLQVSLQSLVFPDGSHLPIYAQFDGNPGQTQQNPPKIQNLGSSLSNYGQSLRSMAFSFVAGPGFMMRKMNRGNEFFLSKGEVVPLRLTRPLDIPPEMQTTQPLKLVPGVYEANSQPVPGLVDAQGSLNPQGPLSWPSTPATAQAMPPLAGQAQQTMAPSFGSTSATYDGSGRTSFSSDPNAIFNSPMQPGNPTGIADPF